MDRQPDQALSAWLLEHWATKLADVVESMTDVRPTVEVSGEQLEGGEFAGAAPSFQELALSLASDAAFLIATPEQSWLKIGEMALRAVGLEQADPADARNTYLEILNQASSGAAQDLGRRMGREITVLAGKDLPAAPAGVAFARIELTAGELEKLPIFLALTPALRKVIDEPRAESTPEGGEAAPQGAVAERKPQAGDIWTGPPLNARTLDLLMEVELPLSVSFGRARLALRDVLKLTSGSIVELNRSVSEPVELIINGAVIARGEVVVVEGNYGVKINQIISRQERLRTLK
jgi:flagellar motor switch protein FliN/FliY